MIIQFGNSDFLCNLAIIRDISILRQPLFEELNKGRILRHIAVWFSHLVKYIFLI